MVAVSDTNFLLANKASGGECIQKIKNGRDSDTWDAFGSRGCNTEELHQKIELIESGGAFSLKTSDDNYFVVTGQAPGSYGNPNGTSDDVRALWDSDRSGQNNSMQQHGWFGIYGTGKNTGKTGRDALKNGPIKIGSTYFSSKRFHMEDANGFIGERLRNFDNNDSGASNDAQTFIHYGLLSECNKRDIPFVDCTKTKLEDCTDSRNSNITNCPKEYCKKPENVSKPECKTVCDTNPGMCDDAANNYCSVDANKTKEFCNCFGSYPPSDLQKALEGKGHTLRRICNLDSCVNNQSSYKTEAMKGQNCPSLQVCIQGVETGDIGGASNFSNVNFSCTQNSGSPPLPAPVPHNAPPPPSSPPSSPPQASSVFDTIPTVYLITGGIVIFLILIMMMFRG